jgi:DNA primase
MAVSIPKDFLELLLQRLDLVILIDAKFPLRKKSASNYFACCPFHKEKTASFCVSRTKQFYYCFGCGAHGNAIDFMINYERLDFVAAVTALAQFAGLSLPGAKVASIANSKNTQLLQVMQQAENFYSTQLQHSQLAQQYLHQRGITPNIIATFKLGYAPPTADMLKACGKKPTQHQTLVLAGLVAAHNGKHYARFRERIMFPISDQRGRCIGFGGRLIGNGEPKYLNSPETPLFHKGHELYGLPQVLQANRSLAYVIVVEGYMDMLALFQHGITCAVATLGTAITEYQIKSLLRYTNNIVFCFDGDNAGRKAATRALQIIWRFIPDNACFRFMFLPEGDDPDSFVRRSGQEAFIAQLATAKTLSQYFLTTMASNLDLSSIDGKTVYLNTALQHVKQLPEGLFKKSLIAQLEQQTRIKLSEANNSNKLLRISPEAVQSKKRRSALRYALALLIQYPQLVADIAEPLPTATELPGIALFNAVLAQIKHNQAISTGALLESWRNQPSAKLLGLLAQQQFLLPEPLLKLEFSGAVQQIHKQIQQQEIQTLLTKSATLGLTPQERTAIIAIINKRQSGTEH